MTPTTRRLRAAVGVLARPALAALLLAPIGFGLQVALATATAVGAASAVAAQAAAPGEASASVKGLTAVAGIKVGHHTLSERPTGCTVILVDGAGATGGVAQRGGAPGTRETDLLNPLNMVDKVNAVVLSGGSAYGLDAAQGTMRFLEERGIGWPVGASGVVPIVPAAILMDLAVGGNPRIRPTADCGYKGAQAASDGPVGEGNVGAGAGATVGKFAGGRPMKGGVGSAAIVLPNGVGVGAIAAVNAAGDVIDPATGQVVAGARSEDGKRLADVRQLLRSGALLRTPGRGRAQPGQNTTIAVVATNARLSKADASRMAAMADDGLARAIAPAHTPGDGDTVFALATGVSSQEVPVAILGALAADVLAEAIVRAVAKAQAVDDIPAARDLGTVPARLR